MPRDEALRVVGRERRGVEIALGELAAQLLELRRVVLALRALGHDLAAYAASKAALQQYSKVVAVRYAPQNVRINTVIPGLMFTPLVTVRLAKQQAGGDAEGLIARRHAKPPMGRMGDAWDVAYAALYLASDEARYVTGAEIMVDGGLSNTVR